FELPACSPRRSNQAVQVRLQGGTNRHDSISSCHYEFVMTIAGQATREVLCHAGCGPYGFDAELLVDGSRVSFECWEDIQRVQGIVSVKSGALVLESWDAAFGGPRPPLT